jgi:multidrug efflux pump subunit AcrA (membrane-fusion protein)
MFRILLIFFALNLMASVKKPEVFTEQLKSKDIQKKLVFPAVVRSQKQSLILAENSGVVTRLKKQLGYSVAKNEVIGFIENPDPIYQFKPLPIRSPIAGRITDMRFFEGSQVEKGTHIITVTDPKSLVVEVQVPAKDISQMKIGGTAEFMANDKIKVKLIGLSPTPDATSLTSMAIFSFVDPKVAVTSGLQGSVEYVSSVKKMVLVNESNIIRKGPKTFLRKYQDGKVLFVEVGTGDRVEDQIEIVSGLKEGDEFISKTAKHIKDGDEVTKVESTN